MSGVEEVACVGSSKGADDAAGGNSNGSLCDGAESDDVKKEMNGIASSPGAVNISTLDTALVLTSHELSMYKNECWALGAMPGSPVILALTQAPKSQAVKSKVSPLSLHHITEATLLRFGSPALGVTDAADIAVGDAAGA